MIRTISILLALTMAGCDYSGSHIGFWMMIFVIIFIAVSQNRDKP